jgi:hypothetical protein
MIENDKSKEEVKEIKTSQFEIDIIQGSLKFVRNLHNRTADAAKKAGDIPSNFGNHAEIPEDAINTIVVSSKEKEE